MDIKVKAWDPVRRKMFTDPKWVEFIIVDGVLKARNFDHLRKEQYLTIIQFAGLTDKNGVDIYEGDIVRAYGHGPMPNPSFVKKIVGFKDGAFTNCLDRREYGVEVIGNIFENKELLAQGG